VQFMQLTQRTASVDPLYCPFVPCGSRGQATKTVKSGLMVDALPLGGY
jgi:hypothetical protein